MTFKAELTKAMDYLAADKRTRFIGYGLRSGKALGTLANVPAAQIVETTVAENLMMGMAVGMSLAGLRPVVYFERLDFIMNAMDALINHLDKIAHESGEEFTPAVIIRATVGNKKKPLFTGSTHCGDYGQAVWKAASNLELAELTNPEAVMPNYEVAFEQQEQGQSMLLVEYKDLI